MPTGALLLRVADGGGDWSDNDIDEYMAQRLKRLLEDGRVAQDINATVFQQLTFELLSHVLINVVVRSVVTAIDYWIGHDIDAYMTQIKQNYILKNNSIIFILFIFNLINIV